MAGDASGPVHSDPSDAPAFYNIWQGPLPHRRLECCGCRWIQYMCVPTSEVESRSRLSSHRPQSMRCRSLVCDASRGTGSTARADWAALICLPISLDHRTRRYGRGRRMTGVLAPSTPDCQKYAARIPQGPRPGRRKYVDACPPRVITQD
jgi:hypothetical protein